jgi:hypothetical protein
MEIATDEDMGEQGIMPWWMRTEATKRSVDAMVNETFSASMW